MVHQATADTASPARRVHGDGVELPQDRVDRIARRADAHEPNDDAGDFSNGPFHSFVCQVTLPAGDTLGGEFPNTEEVSEPLVPGLDVDASDDLGVVGYRLSQLNHGVSLAPSEAPKRRSRA